MWFGEICSCCSLTALPGSCLNTFCSNFFSPRNWRQMRTKLRDRPFVRVGVGSKTRCRAHLKASSSGWWLAACCCLSSAYQNRNSFLLIALETWIHLLLIRMFLPRNIKAASTGDQPMFDTRAWCRVAHLLRERFMLTSNSKFRHRPRSQDRFTAKRNFKFRVNISLSRSRWATLYSYENRPIHNPGWQLDLAPQKCKCNLSAMAYPLPSQLQSTGWPISSRTRICWLQI